MSSEIKNKKAGKVCVCVYLFLSSILWLFSMHLAGESVLELATVEEEEAEVEEGVEDVAAAAEFGSGEGSPLLLLLLQLLLLPLPVLEQLVLP